jgi:hypothetical protein
MICDNMDDEKMHCLHHNGEGSSKGSMILTS